MDYKKIFGMHEDSSILCVWSTGKYTLRIIYDVNKPHLTSSFSKYSKENIQEYILQHTEEAFLSAIEKIDEDCYELNIASNFHFYGAAGDDVYKRMLEIFMPIIQKFMVEALTGGLDKKEEG